MLADHLAGSGGTHNEQIAAELKITQRKVAHLVRASKVSNDPTFGGKLEDVLGLDLNALDHAIVLCSLRGCERSQERLDLASLRAIMRVAAM